MNRVAWGLAVLTTASLLWTLNPILSGVSGFIGMLVVVSWPLGSRSKLSDMVGYATMPRARWMGVFRPGDNFAHVQFDPERDDLREIVDYARVAGFEEYDKADMSDGTKMLVFRRSEGSGR